MAGNEWEWYLASEEINTGQPGSAWGIKATAPESSRHPLVVKLRIGADRGVLFEQLLEFAQMAERGEFNDTAEDAEFEAKDMCDPKLVSESLTSLAYQIVNGKGPL
jgi:hypothetical protein